jgi:ubiquinone/menaquinone biosynthesis C-methylase UbiE
LSRDVLSDLEVLDQLVQPAGKDVVDIGCGAGVLVRALAARGARATGVEISEEQLAPALRDDDGSGARYLVGRAERLPLDDASVDAVVFMRSLHHVPAADLLGALREARRVLRPDGLVYVAEPLAQGDFFELTRMVEDEVEVRAAAQRALGDAGEVGLERVRTREYEVRLCLQGLEALRARIVSVDPARAPRFEARRAELAEAFERLGEAGARPGVRCFGAPMRADVLRPVASRS